MTITELLNQRMPQPEYWENFIYLLEDEFCCIKSVPKVQHLLGRLTGEHQRPSAKFIRNQFKRNFMG
ncbi:gp108 [Erwinia phage vB_EamP-S6]|uniref:Gp108 n=1 Tax=Erwinia phage vB_EamP-S6 TaxID=1051675 RepID=G0YQK0_9CAUD|nr:gp108 [Erwinia phage vB_EamP-S6]AEJ81627.1 gp108 [Erwinia phage vB_EamP-S6]